MAPIERSSDDQPPLIVTSMMVGTFASGQAWDGRFATESSVRVGSFGPSTSSLNEPTMIDKMKRNAQEVSP